MINSYLCTGFVIGFISCALLYLIDELIPFFKDFKKFLKEDNNHENS